MQDGERHWWWHRPFLYIGRMAEDKGVAEILKAWLEVKTRFDDDCPPLWFAGGSPEEIETVRAMAGWQAPIVNFERKGEIIWWGYMDAAGISALLSRAGVVVMHSRYEPGGRVVLEAMSQGVPVIATPHGFAAELIENWKTGFLVEFGDHAGLVLRMSHFVRQPLLRNVLGTDAKQSATQALECWDFMGVHCEVYDQVTARGRLDGAWPLTTRDAPEPRLFRQRRVLPTYPIHEVVPSDVTVSVFVEKSTGDAVLHLEPITTGPGSSLRWRARTSDAVWIVKWPYTRLNKSVLWDSLSPNRLLTTAQTRFQREYLSGSLPGFVPWEGVAPEHLLLMRREGEHVRGCSPDTIAAAKLAYQKLAAAPFVLHDLATLLKQEWPRADQQQLLAARRELHQQLAEDPWDDCALPSLRMAWRMMELDLYSGAIPRGIAIPGELFNDIRLFSDLAESEVTLPVTLTQGGGDPEHCLWMQDGTLGIIDGEHIHPALAGEDLAALIYYSVEDSDLDAYNRQVWPALLEAAAQDIDERDRLLSWMGYLAMDGVREAATLMKPEAFEKSLASLRSIVHLAKLSFNR